MSELRIKYSVFKYELTKCVDRAITPSVDHGVTIRQLPGPSCKHLSGYSFAKSDETNAVAARANNPSLPPLDLRPKLDTTIYAGLTEGSPCTIEVAYPVPCTDDTLKNCPEEKRMEARSALFADSFVGNSGVNVIFSSLTVKTIGGISAFRKWCNKETVATDIEIDQSTPYTTNLPTHKH